MQNQRQVQSSYILHSRPRWVHNETNNMTLQKSDISVLSRAQRFQIMLVFDRGQFIAVASVFQISRKISTYIKPRSGAHAWLPKPHKLIVSTSKQQYSPEEINRFETCT